MPKYYEPSCFETDYSSFLKDRLSGGTKKYGSYVDPDCVGDVRKTDFYNDLTDFLNGREKELEKELRSSYFFLPPAYAPQTPKWLEKHEDKKNSVDGKIITVEEKNDTDRLFRLKSDQFGFSAAETIYEENRRHKYPLSRLLYFYEEQKKEEQEKTINRITECVKNSRTIGGSFLWPVPLEGRCDFRYNMSRGVNSYLEDRVDLTLLEIKHVINGRNNNNFEKCKSDIWLYDEYEKDGQEQKVNTHMKQWFDHFDSFQEYVEYFMLEPFCQKVIEEDSEKGYDYIPVNIIDGELIDEKKIDEYCKSTEENWAVRNLEEKEILNMLDRLEEMILIRTANMERAIESYRKEQKISHKKQ